MATLSGIAALGANATSSATVAPVVSGAAARTATATLSATAIPPLTAVTGSATLTGTATSSFSAAVPGVTVTASCAGTARATVAATSSVHAAGALSLLAVATSSSSVATQLAGTVTATGRATVAASGSAPPIVSGSAAWTATAAQTAAAAVPLVTVTGSASGTGVASVTAAGAITPLVSGTAPLTGRATMAATAAVPLTTVTGTLAATGRATWAAAAIPPLTAVEGSAAPTGTSALTGSAAVVPTVFGTTAWTATAASSSASMLLPRGELVAGAIASATAAVALVVISTPVNAIARATLAAFSPPVARGEAAWTARATLAATGSLPAIGTAALSAFALLAAAGSVVPTVSGSSSAVGVATAAANGVLATTVTGAAAWNAAAATSFAVSPVVSGTVAMTGTANLVAAGTVAVVSMLARATLTATPPAPLTTVTGTVLYLATAAASSVVAGRLEGTAAWTAAAAVAAAAQTPTTTVTGSSAQRATATVAAAGISGPTLTDAHMTARATWSADGIVAPGPIPLVWHAAVTALAQAPEVVEHETFDAKGHAVALLEAVTEVISALQGVAHLIARATLTAAGTASPSHAGAATLAATALQTAAGSTTTPAQTRNGESHSSARATFYADARTEQPPMPTRVIDIGGPDDPDRILFDGNPDAAGVSWCASDLAGWDSPEGELVMADRPVGDGQVHLLGRYSGRRVDLVNAMILAPTEAARATAMDRVAFVTQLVRNTRRLVVTENGASRFANVFRREPVRMRPRPPAMDNKRGMVWPVVLEVPFVAPDPRKYALTQKDQSVTVGSGAGGASIVTANDGTYETPWVATFTANGWPGGSLILNAGDNKPRIDLANVPAMSTGDQLIIDSAARTVYRNTANRRDLVSALPDWSGLAAGSETISFSRGNTTGSLTLRLVYRSAWI